MDLVITHQGQCPHQVSLNLADPHFQGLTRFLSQGLLKILTSDLYLFPLLIVARFCNFKVIPQKLKLPMNFLKLSLNVLY